MTATSDAEPNAIAVAYDGIGGLLIQPLPLPGGMTPAEWLAALPLGEEQRATALWTLGVAPPREPSITPTQDWQLVTAPAQ